ncbi:protein quaking-B-like [Paramacrobiotus metropolitanus]|uniref:protein quaking-B-like n=1 Tax=Paramacrobiotus metropolitanus TaxID=2943436 RepID=UPI002445CA8B|nr:protein quaking-B-like [Paramacrobiotus metropolitanus]
MTDHPSLQNLSISSNSSSGYSSPGSGILSNGNYIANMGKRVQAHLQPGGTASVNGLLSSSYSSGASAVSDLNRSAGRSPSISPKSSPHHSSNDALNSSASISSGVGSQNSSVLQTSIAPGSLADHLGQLLRDKRQLANLPRDTFMHVERLLDEEISKVRISLFQDGEGPKELVLPEEEGPAMTQTEKVFIPVDEHPDFNFVGRILGPRGLTAKQLEKETQCKIMIRGKGSMRDKQKEAQNRGKPNWEHLDENLHVLISVEDTPERGRIKLKRAADEVRKLLVPMNEADDELKKRQLMELAIINGTYRESPKAFAISNGMNPIISQYYVDNATRMLANQAAMVQAAARQQTLGAPLMLPATHQHMGNTSGSSPRYYHASASPVSLPVPDATGLLLNPYEYAAAASYNPALAASLLNGDYTTLESLGAVGGVIKQKRHLGTNREQVPYSRPATIAGAPIVTGNTVSASASSSST